MAATASSASLQKQRQGCRSGVRFRLSDIFLVAYIASVPFLSGNEATADLSQLLGVLLAGTFAVLVLLNRRPVRIPTEVVLFAAFLGYVAIGVFVAKQPGVVVSRLITLSQLWILTVVVFNLLSTRPDAHFLGWRSYVAGVLLASAVSLVSSGGNVVGRFSGTFVNPNTYGLVLLMGVGGLLLLPARTKISLFVRTGLLALFVWQIALTGSRKAILATVVLLSVYALVTLRSNLHKPLRAMTLAVIIAIAGVATVGWLQTTPYWYRIENLFLFMLGEEVDEGSVYSRADFIRAGLSLWERAPLLGLGADQYRYHLPTLGLRETYSHSNPIEILVNFGLAGFVLFYGIYARLTWRFWRLWKKYRDVPEKRTLIIMATALWVTWVILEIASVSYLSKSHWILVSLLLAMTYSLERSQRDLPGLSVRKEHFHSGLPDTGL